MRSFFSLFLTFTAILLALSGIVLFLSPPSRVASDISWTFLWLGREQWLSLHLCTAFVVLILTLIHLLVYNWRVFVSYLKTRDRKVLSLRPGLFYSLLATVVILLGSALLLPPFNMVPEAREGIKDYYRGESVDEPREEGEEERRRRGRERQSSLELFLVTVQADEDDRGEREIFVR